MLKFPEKVIFKFQYLRNALSDFKTVFSCIFSLKMSTKRILLETLPVTTGSDGRSALMKNLISLKHVNFLIKKVFKKFTCLFYKPD